MGTDALGRPIYANEIYDPSTRAINPANGLGYANPFPGNKIPASELSASSLAFLALYPQPQNSNLVGNYNGIIAGGRYSAIPSIKVDEILSDKDKLSFFWSRNNTEKPDFLSSWERGWSADGERWLPRHIHSYLDDAPELRPHHFADDPAALRRRLLSHQL